MIRNIILNNMLKAINAICGRLAWYEAAIVVRIRRGVKYAVLTFKTAAGVVMEARANFNKVGAAFYKSLVISGKFFNF